MLYALGITGTIGLILGTFSAAVADMFPAHRGALQGWGGGLLVASVALIGFTVPMI
jgi:hypothetical protein